MKKNKIQNIIQNLIIYLLLLIVVLYVIFNPVGISDEIWNFQNILKMYNGLKIYSESNVIITPMFFYIGTILFKIFGNGILIFRIYSIIIFSCFFCLIYLILKNLKFKKTLIIIYLSLIFEFMFSIISVGANYNILAVIFVLIGLNLYIMKKSNNLIQGILIFLIFFTKQNIGAIYAITIISYELYLNKFSKEFIYNQLKKFLFFVIPLSFCIIYMWKNGNLNDCINYTIGGLLDFGTNNLVFSAYGYHVALTISVIMLYILIILKKDSIFKNVISKEKFEILTLLFIFSMGMTFIIFPIVNSAHYTMVVPFYLIFLFYLFNEILIEDILGDEKYGTNIKWIVILLFFIMILRIFTNIILWHNDVVFIKDKESKYYGTYIYKEDIEKFGNIKNYIIEKNSEGIDVIICSYEAARVMIDLEQSHGAYDLPFNGNFGYDGVNRMKKDILSKKNTEFLIFTDEKDMFWQESKEIRDCIINNLNYVGDIENYSIYSTEEQ